MRVYIRSSRRSLPIWFLVPNWLIRGSLGRAILLNALPGDAVKDVPPEELNALIRLLTDGGRILRRHKLPLVDVHSADGCRVRIKL